MPDTGALPQAISVVIPAVNEAASLGRTLERIAGAPRCETIVVDGRSDDGTTDVARAHHARVLTVERARGLQMNAGAADATGGVLLFLHADTLLPHGFDEEIDRVLADPAVSLGAFRLHIDASRRGLRMVQTLVNWRSRRLRLPYGDQALFLRARTFRACGGFQPWPAMEDVDLVLRLRRRGAIGIASRAVHTSARRWLDHGILRTTLLNQFCLWAFLMGVAPERIARWRGRRQVQAPAADGIPSAHRCAERPCENRD